MVRAEFIRPAFILVILALVSPGYAWAGFEFVPGPVEQRPRQPMPRPMVSPAPAPAPMTPAAPSGAVESSPLAPIPLTKEPADSSSAMMSPTPGTSRDQITVPPSQPAMQSGPDPYDYGYGRADMSAYDPTIKVRVLTPRAEDMAPMGGGKKEARKIFIDPFPMPKGKAEPLPISPTPLRNLEAGYYPSGMPSSPHKSYEDAVGFGSDVPLAMALRQVTPADYSFSFGPGVNVGEKVSWNGGKPWNQVLSDMLAPLNLRASIRGNIVYIESA